MDAGQGTAVNALNAPPKSVQGCPNCGRQHDTQWQEPVSSLWQDMPEVQEMKPLCSNVLEQERKPESPRPGRDQNIGSI